MSNIRTLAESDLSTILEDGDNGFGWPITVTTPTGVTEDFVGQSDDISQVIDPDTGQAVSGRLASVALRMSSLIAALPGEGLPKGIADTASKPWIVEFNDINGSPYKFKVSQSNPDRALGVVVCLLEVYK